MERFMTYFETITDSRENQERFCFTRLFDAIFVIKDISCPGKLDLIKKLKEQTLLSLRTCKEFTDILFENKMCYPETIQDNGGDYRTHYRFDLSRITSYTDFIYLNNKVVRIEDLEIKKLIGII